MNGAAHLERRLTLSFTDLIYGVVVGFAISSFTLELRLSNLLLLGALVLILDDFVLYHVSAPAVDESGRNLLLMFLTDLVVLGCWHAVVLAAKSETLHLFWIATTIFYCSTAAWEFIFATKQGRWRVLLPESALAGFAALLAAARDFLPVAVQLLAFFAALAFARMDDWRELWRQPAGTQNAGRSS